MTAAPSTTPAREVIPATWGKAAIDTRVTEVEQTIQAHETGQFATSALLCDAMMRDDRMFTAMLTRMAALTGSDFSLDASDTAHKGRVQSVADDASDMWKECCSVATVKQLMFWGVLLGVAVGEITYERTETKWTPKLKVWHPSNLYFDATRDIYVLFTQDGIVDVTPGDGRWVIYEPNGHRSWMGGVFRSIALPWLLRQFDWRDWARYSEKHGLPTTVVKVPSTAGGPAKAALFNNIRMLGRETTLMLPQGAGNDASYSVEMLEAKSVNWQTFKELLGEANTAITLVILGQNLTTEVKGGSYAAAKVHDSIRRDILQADAMSLSDVLRKQVLMPWAEYNYGDPELAPKPNWNVEPPADLAVRGTTLFAFAQALTAFRTALVPVDIKAIAEDFDVPLTDDVIAPLPDPNAAPAPAAPPPPKPGDKPPAIPANVAASAVLLGENNAATKGQIYADAVGDHTHEIGTRLVAPDVLILQSLIEKASTYAELRANLTHAFKGMDPTQLAKLIERAMILAKLGGRFAVQEDL